MKAIIGVHLLVHEKNGVLQLLLQGGSRQLLVDAPEIE